VSIRAEILNVVLPAANAGTLATVRDTTPLMSGVPGLIRTMSPFVKKRTHVADNGDDLLPPAAIVKVDGVSPAIV